MINRLIINKLKKITFKHGWRITASGKKTLITTSAYLLWIPSNILKKKSVLVSLQFWALKVKIP